MKDAWSDTKASELLHVFIRKVKKLRGVLRAENALYFKFSPYQALNLVRQWLLEHREFVSNPFYVAGVSYGGKLVPIVTQKIIDGN